MNCKPNDFAILVRNTWGHGCIDQMIGMPVRVDEPIRTMFHGRDAWTLHGQQPKCPNCGYVFLGLYDADLQPIRGDGARESADAEKPLEVAA